MLENRLPVFVTGQFVEGDVLAYMVLYQDASASAIGHRGYPIAVADFDVRQRHLRTEGGYVIPDVPPPGQRASAVSALEFDDVRFAVAIEIQKRRVLLHSELHRCPRLKGPAGGVRIADVVTVDDQVKHAVPIEVNGVQAAALLHRSGNRPVAHEDG